MKHLHLDIESRSCADLKQVGVHEYARDPTTDVWCAAYGFKVGEIKLWFPGEPCPPEIVDHVAQGGTLRIWNSQFERVMWANILGPRYGWPMPALEQFECVMAKAYALALPGSLEDAGAALGMAVQKDMDGKRLMMQMARPRKSKDGSLRWWDEPEKIQRLAAYCVRDVEAELVIDELLLDLQPSEKKVFLLNQKANDLGVFIDRDLASAALEVVDATKAKMDGDMRRLTGGAVPTCTNAAGLVRWLNAQGVETDSVDKASISKLLAAPDVNPLVRPALYLRQEAAKSSTAKVEVLRDRSATDGWMRGLTQYHGAATGREAARGAQLQNLPRPQNEDVDSIITAILAQDIPRIEMVWGSPMAAVADCIRGMIAAPPGKVIYCADFSAIEARVLPWLAGEHGVLDVFRTGADIYCHAASPIFGFPVNKKDHPKERQVGKTAILGLGFAGGIGAFGTFAKSFGIDMAPVLPRLNATEMEIKKAEKSYNRYVRSVADPMGLEAGLASDVIKQRWRKANSATVVLWAALNEAAINAVENPGKAFKAGEHLKYKMVGNWLFCRLPSGRCLAYPSPRIRYEEVEFETDEGEIKVFKAKGVRYMGVNSITRKWSEMRLGSHTLAENCTQSVARDLMVEAALRLDAAGYDVALTVHDEVIAYADEGTGSVEDFCGIMAEVPAWATDCPIAAEGWVGKRYRK